MIHDQWLVLPRLVRFMTANFADGVASGWALGLMLIWFDVYGVGTLFASYEGALPTVLFFAQSGMLFGTLCMSVAVMNLGDDKE